MKKVIIIMPVKYQSKRLKRKKYINKKFMIFVYV